MSFRRDPGHTRARPTALGALLMACSLGLNGCVAAAIPLAAGGALVAARKGKVETPPASIPASAGDFAAYRVTPTDLAALPPPSAAVGSGTPGSLAIEAFGAYARAWLGSAPGARQSALLIGASSLTVRRSVCGTTPPAVFIDLDPGKGSFDPLQRQSGAPQLAAILADLRVRGVRIVWFSRLGENFAAAAQAVLRDSGLDPAGEDQRVLMRDLGERKQSRRDEMARTLCPIAMLGDERADFDELYLYLRQVDAASALDAMIGRGWFLADPLVPAEQLSLR